MKNQKDRGWLKAINDAVRFTRSTTAIDLLFTGKIIEGELNRDELKEYRRLESILGENVTNYIGSILTGSISGGGGSLPKKTEEKEEKARQKEYKRIRALSPEALRQEAEKYATEMREEENG